MGCQASRSQIEDHQLSSPFMNPESKRFSSLTYMEKPDNNLEFTLKLVPYNTEIERVAQISIEIARYSLQRRPPLSYTLIDLFYNSPEDLNSEEKLLFKVVENSSQEKLLLKMVPFQSYEDYVLKACIYEIYVLQLLKSQNQGNLIKLRDFFINDFGKNRKKFLVFMFEECEFTLTDLMIYRMGTKNLWKEEEQLRLMREFADIGLALQAADICHRDIRPENFWYSEKDHRWKLANFSNARLYQIKENEAFSHDLMLNTFRGKLESMSPEVTKLYKENPQKKYEVFNALMNDVYGLGLVFLMINKTSNKLERSIIEKAQIMENWEDSLSVEVICKMMTGNIKRRCFYENVRDLLKQEDKQAPSFRERKMELTVHEEFNRSMKNEQSLGLKILKQEKFAHAYFKLLQTDHALNQFDELLSFFESNSDEENQANTLKEIGELCVLLGNNAKATELFKASLAIYNKLGSEARKNGNYSKAVQLYEKALGLAGMLYGSNDPNFIQVLENCGNAYRLAGRYSEAKTCQEKALGIIIKLKGEKSIEVARLLNNLANTYAGLKDYDTSIELLKNSIQIIRSQFMKDNPNLLAMALCNLGEVYRHKKVLDEAKISIEEALIIKEKIFGSDPNLEVAAALDNLGNVYYDLGEIGKAKKLYEKSLIMKEGELGEFNCEIALSLNNLGNACRCLKEFKVAEGYYKKGIQIYRTHIQEKHPSFAATLGNLGLTYKDMGKKNDAKKNLNDAVKILKECLGENDNDYKLFKKELDELS